MFLIETNVYKKSLSECFYKSLLVQIINFSTLFVGESLEFEGKIVIVDIKQEFKDYSFSYIREFSLSDILDIGVPN